MLVLRTRGFGLCNVTVVPSAVIIEQLTGVFLLIKRVFISFYCMCVHVLPAPHTCLVTSEPEEDIGALGTRVTDHSDL